MTTQREWIEDQERIVLGNAVLYESGRIGRDTFLESIRQLLSLRADCCDDCRGTGRRSMVFPSGIRAIDTTCFCENGKVKR